MSLACISALKAKIYQAKQNIQNSMAEFSALTEQASRNQERIAEAKRHNEQLRNKLQEMRAGAKGKGLQDVANAQKELTSKMSERVESLEGMISRLRDVQQNIDKSEELVALISHDVHTTPEDLDTNTHKKDQDQLNTTAIVAEYLKLRLDVDNNMKALAKTRELIDAAAVSKQRFNNTYTHFLQEARQQMNETRDLMAAVQSEIAEEEQRHTDAGKNIQESMEEIRSELKIYGKNLDTILSEAKKSEKEKDGEETASASGSRKVASGACKDDPRFSRYCRQIKKKYGCDYHLSAKSMGTDKGARVDEICTKTCNAC